MVRRFGTPLSGATHQDRVTRRTLGWPARPALAASTITEPWGAAEDGITLTGIEASGTPARRKPPHRRPAAAFLRWSRAYVSVMVTADVFVAVVAIAVAIFWLPPNAVDPEHHFTIMILVAGAAIWPLAIASAHGYDRRRIGVGSNEMRAVFRAGIAVVVIGAFPAGITGSTSWLTLVVSAVPLAAAASIGSRYVGRKQLHRRQKDGYGVRTVVVVGSPVAAADLSDRLTAEPTSGMQVIGVCVPADGVADGLDLNLQVLGDLDHVAAVVEEFGCDAVAVTSGDATRHHYLRELAWSLEDLDVELLVHPGLMEVAGPRMHIRPYVGLPLLHIEQPHFTGWRRIIKRATDVVLTGLGLLAISPLLAAIAIAIKADDGGPVFFRQKRVGLDGEEFTMLKFRSMAVDAEARLAALMEQNEGAGPLFKMKKDPRITRIGTFLRRFSLDELPQLFNVLSGTMSLVGPRPPLQSEVVGYADDARRRLLVTPGVTGLWQVSGRSELSWEESVRLDLRYVENWTLTFDLLILWKTVFAVVRAQGAY